MNTKLNIIQRRISLVRSAQDDVNSGMKKIFPKGKAIVFKRTNMKKATPAIVIWAMMMNGHAELRVTNELTGKDSTISFDDVVSI